MGVYIVELDVWFIAVALDGQAPHTGLSPTVPTSLDPKYAFELCDAAYTYAGAPKYCVYVPHFGTAACDHTASSSIFPPTCFANSEAPDPTKTYPLNFSEHGKDLLGDSHSTNTVLHGSYCFSLGMLLRFKATV